MGRRSGLAGLGLGGFEGQGQRRLRRVAISRALAARGGVLTRAIGAIVAAGTTVVAIAAVGARALAGTLLAIRTARGAVAAGAIALRTVAVRTGAPLCTLAAFGRGRSGAGFTAGGRGGFARRALGTRAARTLFTAIAAAVRGDRCGC